MENEKKEKKKSKKGLIITLVIIIVLLLGALGYFVYDKYFKEEPTPTENKVENKVEAPGEEQNFYDLNNLIDSNYIKKIESTSMERDSYNPSAGSMESVNAIRINNGEVYVNFNEELTASGIEGVPKYVYYSNDIGGQAMALYVLTESGDLYYSLTYGDSANFEKINTLTVTDIYTTKIDNILYGCNMTGIFAYLENETLVEVTFNGDFNSNSTFESICTYVDNVPRPSAGLMSNNLLITSERELYISNGDSYNKISENNIKAKDGFAYMNSTGDELVFNNYIIDENNVLYRIDTYSNSSNYNVSKVKEVSDYNFKITDRYSGTVSINFTDGTSETFEECTISSLHFRSLK